MAQYVVRTMRGLSVSFSIKSYFNLKRHNQLLEPLYCH